MDVRVISQATEGQVGFLTAKSILPPETPSAAMRRKEGSWGGGGRRKEKRIRRGGRVIGVG